LCCAIILQQAWATHGLRSACGSLLGFMRLSLKYPIYSHTSRKILLQLLTLSVGGPTK